MKVLRFNEWRLNEQRIERESILIDMIRQDEEIGLYEGGAYGHLMHPFEDYSLTFHDLEEMIDITVTGAFNPSNFTQEKTDGQNLMFSWKDGKIIGARTKKHLRNSGENALTKSDVETMYAGRGNIQTAFTAAVEDLEQSISHLSVKQQDKIFANGKKFMSVEIMTPMTQNTVPYGMSMLVFHGTNEYDDDGNVLNQDKGEAKMLAGMIKQVNKDVQNTFHIRGPQDIKLDALPDTSKKQSYYKAKLKKLVNEFSLSMDQSIPDYLFAKWRKHAEQVLKEQGIESSDELLDGLANRWGRKVKKYSVSNITKASSKEFAEWVKDFEKDKSKWDRLYKEYIHDVEGLFLELGADVLLNVKTFLTVDRTAAADEMRKEIDATIKQIKSSKDEDAITKMEVQLKRIETAGGLDRLVPTEGLTFIYKGKLYKYTGLFASVHRLVSMTKY